MVDLFSKQQTLYVNGKPKFTTHFSACLSLLFLGIAGYIIYSFSKDYLTDSNPHIYQVRLDKDTAKKEFLDIKFKMIFGYPSMYENQIYSWDLVGKKLMDPMPECTPEKLNGISKKKGFKYICLTHSFELEYYFLLFYCHKDDISKVTNHLTIEKCVRKNYFSILEWDFELYYENTQEKQDLGKDLEKNLYHMELSEGNKFLPQANYIKIVHKTGPFGTKEIVRKYRNTILHTDEKQYSDQLVIEESAKLFLVHFFYDPSYILIKEYKKLSDTLAQIISLLKVVWVIFKIASNNFSKHIFLKHYLSYFLRTQQTEELQKMVKVQNNEEDIVINENLRQNLIEYIEKEVVTLGNFILKVSCIKPKKSKAI